MFQGHKESRGSTLLSKRGELRCSFLALNHQRRISDDTRGAAANKKTRSQASKQKTFAAWSNSSDDTQPETLLAVRLRSSLLRTRTESAIAKDFRTVTIRHICDGCHDFCQDCDGCHDFCHNPDKQRHSRGTPTFKLKCVACDGFTTGNRKKTESIGQAAHSSIFLACAFLWKIPLWSQKRVNRRIRSAPITR